jgi:DNA polymerase-1
MTPAELPFDEVVLLDFEYSAPPGERPRPVCLVAWELRSSRRFRVWLDELTAMSQPPFAVGDSVLVVAYYASAEVTCFLGLGWAPPRHLLDLFTEFRCLTNGRSLPCGNGLLGAATYFGVSGMSAEDKAGFRALAQQVEWTRAQQSALLGYCEHDVELLSRVLPHVLEPMGDVDLGRALLRGRFMVAAGRIEHAGVPIDVAALARLRDGWDTIKAELIARVDDAYGVFIGTSFSAEKFDQWLARADIPWPRTATGRLALDDDTFRDMARAHAELAPLRELRVALGQLRLADLAVGNDGRNRTLLSAFGSATGRNQPSSSKFIFGPAVWIRSLIRPESGRALAYIDFSQQEFAVGAALSGDRRMKAAYETGDPYLAFAVEAGAAPPGATKESHRAVREQYKQCALGVLYGMGPTALAERLGCDSAQARHLIDMHRHSYPQYWRWSEQTVDAAMLRGRIETSFGWRLHVGPTTRPTSLMNFPMQAGGAEILRLACVMATEWGVEVCAPVHDAVLISAPVASIADHVEVTRESMSWASSVVLHGLRLRTDVTVVRYPDRYADDRGRAMWSTVFELLDARGPCTGARSSCSLAPPPDLFSHDPEESRL